MTRLDPRLALALPPLLFWDSWRFLAVRASDGVTAVPLLLAGLALAIPAARAVVRGSAEPPPLGALSAALALYAVLRLAAPPLIAAAAAAVTTAMLFRTVAGSRLPWAPQAGLVLLALPVLPTLDFFLAYPMRVLGAALSACLLRLNGLAVGVEGVALRFEGTLLLFDAACSGIRMLWTSLFLVSAVALAAGFGLARYAASLGIAVAMAIAANAVRAASLFYVENGFVEGLEGPLAHEAAGLAAFLAFGALTLLLVAPRQWVRT